MVAVGALHVTPLLSMLLPIRVEVTERDKRSSLLRLRINYSRKKFLWYRPLFSPSSPAVSTTSSLENNTGPMQ
jgi:hypothetical protein